MKILPLPPLELLEEYLEVDETSPSGLRWKIKRSHNARPGDVAGWLNKKLNRWYIAINKKKYIAYRIYVYMKTKTCLNNLEVDHKTFDTVDLTDLRVATRNQNEMNKNKMQSRKGQPLASRYKGVTFKKDKQKWRARIKAENKYLFLGHFNSEKEAALAYNAAALKYFGEFARLNVIED